MEANNSHGVEPTEIHTILKTFLYQTKLLKFSKKLCIKFSMFRSNLSRKLKIFTIIKFNTIECRVTLHIPTNKSIIIIRLHL